MISRGEVHWVDFRAPRGFAPAFRRPCVVVQNDAFNASPISTVLVVAITGNVRLGQAFGNVTLRKGEGGLTRKSVVNVSQVATVDRSMLAGRIGKLSQRRMVEVLTGLYALLDPVTV